LGDDTTLPVKIGFSFIKRQDEFVKKGEVLAEFDPFIEPILAEKSGKVRYVNLEKDFSYKEEMGLNHQVKAKSAKVKFNSRRKMENEKPQRKDQKIQRFWIGFKNKKSPLSSL
jgi:hypothetical protein